MFDSTVQWFTVACVIAVIYHHLGYPLVLRVLAQLRSQRQVLLPHRGYGARIEDARLPSVHLIIPAYNEQEFVAEKVRNLATLDYPDAKLRISIVCDGCTDRTAAIAREVHAEPECAHLQLQVVEHRVNRGKVAVINEAVGASRSDIVALSDVSALISADALLLVAEHFFIKRTGVVTGAYHLWKPSGAGEAAYWRYQRELKVRESLLGSTLGAHGAFYAFRRALFEPLPPDTINDDFILPMNIVNQGYRALYEPRITALELETANPSMDYNRRVRIAAGNVQQALRLSSTLDVARVDVAFNFLSGKVLRVVTPYLMLGALLGSVWLASRGSLWFAVLLGTQLVGYALAALPALYPRRVWSRGIRALHYVIAAHLANLEGSLGYALGYHRGRWLRATAKRKSQASLYAHPVARAGKRSADVFGATIGLLLTAPLFPVIALLIKLDSPGPVLFRQVRIGRAWPDYVELFTMLKFRTMRTDAEAKSGPQWASKNDPRVTPLGLWLRKTRLDELPQLINVLMGDMSLVGPRPERPGFYAKLEQEIPFYAERTYGVSPGITGLAQVNQGYDQCIEDVRRKLAFDHAYALALSDPLRWVAADMSIAWKTVAVMVLGRGQ